MCEQHTSRSVARTAHSTGYEPNLVLPEGSTNFISVWDGDGEDLIGLKEILSSDTAQLLQHLKKIPKGTGGLGAGSPKANSTWRSIRTRTTLQHSKPGLPWRIQSYNALRHQQEQLEHAVHEHQRVAGGQVEIAGAFAASPTEARTTRDVGSYTLWSQKQQQR